MARKKERNELSSHKKTWKILKCILLSERSQSNKATYYTLPTIGHSERSKIKKKIKRSVVTGRGGERKGMNKQSKEDFQGSENILHDVIMIHIYHSFVQTDSMYNTKSEPFH